MKVLFTPENVKFLGRSVLFGEKLLLSLSGSGVEFEYTGKGFFVTFTGGGAAEIEDNEANYARMAVYVDRERQEDFLLNQRTVKKKIAESPVEKTSVIRIMKLSECAMSLVSIDPIEISEGESVKPTPAKSFKIEFIGDSITCGYGVEDPDPLHGFKTATEDVTKAFSYKTATALDADFQMFSISGYGIISGYTDDPAVRHEEQLIPTFYESMGLSYDRIEGIPAAQDTAWDFSKYRPDLIVINLGTNDDSYCQDDVERQAWFSTEYAKFLKRVRELNKESRIVCTLGLMGDRLYPSVCRAVEEYSKESGDKNISVLHLPEQDPEVGYGANYHPLESVHQKAAGVLTEYIRKDF